MYEHRSQELIPFRHFVRRFLVHVLGAIAFLSASLLLGMSGYMGLAHMSWVDAFLNSCMLLGGMGPVGELPNDASKIFAGCFALYAGLAFIVAASVIISPVAHRILHKLHMEEA